MKQINVYVITILNARKLAQLRLLELLNIGHKKVKTQFISLNLDHRYPWPLSVNEIFFFFMIALKVTFIVC